MAKYKIIVDRGLCIGAASCVALAPKTFQLDAESKAIVLSTEADTPEDILMAAQACPTAAITIIEEASGEQVWPRK